MENAARLARIQLADYRRLTVFAFAAIECPNISDPYEYPPSTMPRMPTYEAFR